MKVVNRYRKLLAFFVLVVFSFSVFIPVQSAALTSGPQQPEISSFHPIGLNDMVDLFTVDFHYNIPLLDIGGYPLNLSYNSGQTMDDEAGWVGFGWSLNPGSVNRQLRGIPDDFNGGEADGDLIEKQVAVKPFVARGISNPVIKLKRKGRPFPGINPVKMNLGIVSNNYTGIKAEIGFNATLGISSLLGNSATMNLGITSDNQDGATLNGNVNLPEISKQFWNNEFTLNNSVNFSYNSTRGLEGQAFSGLSFKKGIKVGNARKTLNLISGGYAISFAGESYVPGIEIPQRTKSYNYTVRAGGTLFGITLATGISGSYSKQDIAISDQKRLLPAYGFMNAFRAKANPQALMDYNRENDRPYLAKIPYLPLPVINYDLFTLTSQNVSGQYKITSSSSGIFSEHSQKSKSDKFGFGLELAFGNITHVGVPDLSYNRMTNKTGKWKTLNDFKTNGDFLNTSSNPEIPETYFKKVGENSLIAPGFVKKIGEKEAVSVGLRNDAWAKTFGRGTAQNRLNSKSGKVFTSVIDKETQDKRNDLFSYLTAGEATGYGLEKAIRSYPMDSIVVPGCNEAAVVEMPRISESLGKKAHHLSEITLTDKSGTRQVYGIPVYNLRQDEVSFSIKADEAARKRGLFKYSAQEDSLPTSSGDARFTSKDYTFGFNKQRISGYATSFLLTAILSPDYVDITGDGITDDDQGTAVKFNYSKLGNYKWRTPLFNVDGSTQRIANYNEGWISDKKDDKASYVYGEREQWYLHSIESKTMLAVFVLEDRTDALGVLNSDGAIDNSFKLKRLKEIRLYSKADLYKNKTIPSDAIPVKTVHFEYSYEMFTDIPNSATGGKLTLKKVYFTFYKNGSGRMHPYTFEYNIPAYQPYQYRQYDRWGMYKPADSANINGLSNAEFPYSVQNKIKADRWAGYWQLQKINLPTGGSINVKYEADDYAYVQDKRASVMCFLKGVGSVSQNSGIINANTVFIELPQSVSNVTELKEKYFEGMEYLYFKCYVDMDNKNTNYEYVPGYAKIEKVELTNSLTAKVTLSKIDGYNPISKASWQILRNSLPKLAYPEYENLYDDEPDFIKAVKSLVSAVSRISDLVRSFDKRASNKNFASRIDLNKSWVRLFSPDYKKIGGGSRVQKIIMSDKWSAMTGSINTLSASYGQAYNYTTEKTMSDGQVIQISSGVASYEPLVGGDENPFKNPVPFTQKKFLGLDQHYYIELPLGESYFPAPSVGYSKVTVKNIGADDTEGSTGSTTTEFFTAKDYPTRVEVTDLQKVQPALRKTFRIFSVQISDHATVSQGYVVENYNMHGKQKSEKIIDKNNQEVSAIYYQYKTTDNNSLNPTLVNEVPVMGRNGVMQQATLGVDYDFFTDMNEHSSENFGTAGEPAVGFYFSPFPRPWFYVGGLRANYNKRLFRSSVAIKTINSYPILEKVIKVEKGSRIESENVLWDAETGEVLLTKTQNEFDDPIYSFKYPAHWAYEGMGPAYRNQGLYLTDFTSDNDGIISNYGSTILVPGDELIQVVNRKNEQVKKFWVIKATDGTLRTVDESGIVTAVNNKLVKVLRSGRRNLSSSVIGTIVSMNNPVLAGELQTGSMNKIIDAGAAVYNEEWAEPVRLTCETGCPPGYILSPNGFCYSTSKNASSCTNYMLMAVSNKVYSSYGSRIFASGYALDGSGVFTDSLQSGTFWYNGSLSTANGPLNRCGVWATTHPDPKNRWIGVSRKITFPESKVYYIGLAADNFARLKIDGQVILQFSKHGGQLGINNQYYDVHFKYWNIYPVYLSEGVHFIEVCGNNDGDAAGFGCEIYNNTIPQIKSAYNESGLNILFTTKSLRGSAYTNFTEYSECATCPPGYALNPDDNKCYIVAPVNPDKNVFNPYKAGVLGNWRLQRTYTFDAMRFNLPGDAGVEESTNIRNSGYYNSFAPYWRYSSGIFIPNSSNGSFSQWIWDNETTIVNNKGIEVESKDALGRYSAVQTGYLQSTPVAIAANARLRDLAYDGFEDYDFTLRCFADTCNTYQGHFNFIKNINGSSVSLDDQNAHTGNYSLKLSTGITLNRAIYKNNDTLYKRDGKQQYSIYSNFPMLGFSPALPGQKYVLSCWVKDNDNSSVQVSLNMFVNGTQIFNGATYKAPVIEGWKRVESVFTLPSGITTFSLGITPTSTIYLDDLRIHPYDAQVVSYVYDAISLRLLSELDENNFATFYEYDDEGLLIRIKKETERGIMTVSESRTGLKRSME